MDHQSGGPLAGQRVEFVDRLHLVVPERQAPGAVLQMRRENLDAVAPDPERAAVEVVVVAPVLQLYEALEEMVAVKAFSRCRHGRHFGIRLDRAYAIDAGHAGHDDDIAPLQQGARCRVAHPVDLLVDRGFLLDIGVGARDIGFRLVVVVIGNEILDGVLREEALHLGVELGRQRLVGGHDEGRAAHLADDMGGGEGFAGPGDAEQDLFALAPAETGEELFNRLRLVAAGSKSEEMPNAARSGAGMPACAASGV